MFLRIGYARALQRTIGALKDADARHASTLRGLWRHFHVAAGIEFDPLWQHLRDRRLGGHKFRRQQPIGPYVVDFLCMEKGLVVEVDGSQHAVQKERDDARTARLEAYGFRVLRFWNDQVLNETEGVLHKIEEVLDWVGRQDMKPTRPHPPSA